MSLLSDEFEVLIPINVNGNPKTNPTNIRQNLQNQLIYLANKISLKSTFRIHIIGQFNKSYPYFLRQKLETENEPSNFKHDG